MAKKSARRSPVTLSEQQLATEAGRELLELAHSITEDGLVEPAEVTRLHRWLHRHANAGLPAIAFLNAQVDQLREDEKAGDTWPRRRLHRALERVLPMALREKAKAVRKEAETLEFAWAPRHPDPPAVELLCSTTITPPQRRQLHLPITEARRTVVPLSLGDPRISWTVGRAGHGRAFADVQVHDYQSRPKHV